MPLLDNSASTVLSGRKVVAAAATAERLSTSDARIVAVEVQAETDNTGTVVIGDSGVIASQSTRKGIALDPGDSRVLNVSQLSAIWLDVTTSGDGVTYLALGA